MGSDTTLKVGGSIEEEQFREERVSPTSVDRFYQLRSDIKDNDWLRTLDMGDDLSELESEALELSAGDFVEIENARLAVPGYASLLPKVTYAGIAREPGVGGNGATRVLHLERRAQVIEHKRSLVNRYLRLLRPDPRIPARANGLNATLDNPGLTVFIPLRYSKLTDSPSLISGRIKLLGKVIRVVREDEVVPPGFRKGTYLDIETRTTFGQALRQGPARVKDLFGLRRGPQIERTVEALATLNPPGLVVIPVAIYH